MTRIAFTADLHVDSYGSKVDAATGLNARLTDYLSTVRYVAQSARDLECEALVVAGDFTERKHVNEWLIRHIQDALSDGPATQVFLRGNHDAEVAGESIVTVLAEMAPGWSGYNRPGLQIVGDVALCLIPHLDGRWLRTQAGFESVPPHEINRVLAEQYLVLARSMYAMTTPHPRPLTRILVAHQGMSGGAMSETQAAFLGDRSLVVDAAALGAIGFDAIVAGHFHRHQVLSTDPLTLYTGSVERVDFAEEGEDKGFVVIDTDELPAFTFNRTPARRYVTVTQAGLEMGIENVEGAVVRCLDLDPATDRDGIRAQLEADGAFEIHELRHVRVDEPGSTRALAEDLTAETALDAYFVDDPEAEALVARGREILEAVA